MDTNHIGFHEYDSDQCSAILSQLPGVFAARLRIEEGSLLEIHVLAATDRNPKQIARDIQSAIFASYGIEVDHRIISIAQLPSDPFTPDTASAGTCEAPHPKDVRPLFSGLDSSISRGRYHVSVRLSWDGQSYTGEADCRDTPSQRNRAIADATLSAVNSMVGRECYSLLEVKQINIWDVTVAVTVIECLEKEMADSIILIGAATQKDNPSAGVVRSTLDGLNRSIGKIYPALQN